VIWDEKILMEREAAKAVRELRLANLGINRG
jgi:hypothetical protein